MYKTTTVILLCMTMLFARKSITPTPEIHTGVTLTEYHHSAGLGGVLGGGVHLGKRHYAGLEITVANNIPHEHSREATLLGMRSSYYYAPLVVDYRVKLEVGFSLAYGKDEYENFHGSWGIPMRFSLGNGRLFWYSEGFASIAYISDLLGDAYTKPPYIASVSTGVAFRFTSPDQTTKENTKARVQTLRNNRQTRTIVKRPRALYLSFGPTMSIGGFNNEIPGMKNAAAFAGAELECGSTWDRHLLYGNFTVAYNESGDTFGGGMGYSFSSVERENVTLRFGGILGCWYMIRSKDLGNFNYVDQGIPFVAGPTLRFEAGRGTTRFFLKERLLIGGGLFNTVTAGLAFDFSRRTVRK